MRVNRRRTLITLLALLVLAALHARRRPDGTVVVWTDTRGGGPVTVSVDGVEAGQLRQFFTGGSPDCTSELGVVQLTVTPGWHQVIASDDRGRWWADTIAVSSECLLLRLSWHRSRRALAIPLH